MCCQETKPSRKKQQAAINMNKFVQLICQYQRLCSFTYKTTNKINIFNFNVCLFFSVCCEFRFFSLLYQRFHQLWPLNLSVFKYVVLSVLLKFQMSHSTTLVAQDIGGPTASPFTFDTFLTVQNCNFLLKIIAIYFVAIIAVHPTSRIELFRRWITYINFADMFLKLFICYKSLTTFCKVFVVFQQDKVVWKRTLLKERSSFGEEWHLSSRNLMMLTRY